jgi:hypothetical protein
MTAQGLFPWSRSVPYEWSRWFAWWPVRADDGRILWLRRVMVRAHGEIAPNGDLTDWYEFDTAAAGSDSPGNEDA